MRRVRRMRSVRRKNSVETPAVRIVVVTEGAVTEREYLLLFKKHYGHRSVKLDLTCGAGDPRSVVEKAIEKVKDLQNDKLATQDIIWAMFDRDAHVRFHEAKDLAIGKGINLAISNPCFELWGIFHYMDYDAPLDRNKCQKILEDLCPGYDRKDNKSFADSELMGDPYQNAVTRAQNSLSRREEEGDPESSPSTTVHKLTEQFRCLVKQHPRKTDNTRNIAVK